MANVGDTALADDVYHVYTENEAWYFPLRHVLAIVELRGGA